MKKYTDIEALKIIISCAKLYKQFLVNKNFLFIYREVSGKYKSTEVLFKPKHFEHLTGNEGRKDISSIHFYSRCVDGVLTVNDLHKGNMMDLKLSVLPMLMKIHKNARMIGNPNGLTVCQITTEKYIGNQIGCLGFKYDVEDSSLVPITAQNGDTRNKTERYNQIVAVYSKPYNNELYSTVCYISKNSDIAKKNIHELIWPKEIECKICKENLKFE